MKKKILEHNVQFYALLKTRKGAVYKSYHHKRQEGGGGGEEKERVLFDSAQIYRYEGATFTLLDQI